MSTPTSNQPTTNPAIKEPAMPTPVIELANPGDLLLDRNLRDINVGATLQASINTNGLLDPPRCVRTADGSLRVRDGHHRTVAAIRAGLAQIPVLVTGNDGDDDATSAQRLIEQYVSNEHRTGPEQIERGRAIAQLAAFGVCTNDITRKTASTTQEVNAAVKVVKDPWALDLMKEQHALTFEQAAIIADFADDDRATDTLIRATQWGRDTEFTHAVNRERAIRERNQARQSAADTFHAANPDVTIIDKSWSIDTTTLTELRDSDGDPITEDNHRCCPGHVAWFEQDDTYVDADGNELDDDALDTLEGNEIHTEMRFTPVLGCQYWNERGHTCPTHSGWAHSNGRSNTPAPPSKEELCEKRRTTIANNKAWREAETVRRDWLTTFATQKKAPKGAAAFLVDSLTTGQLTRFSYALNRGKDLAADYLGLDHQEEGDAPLNGGRYAYRSADTDIAALAAGATEDRALMIALVVALSIHEADTSTETWKMPLRQRGRDERYFTQIQTWGYTLSDVEQLITPATEPG